MTEKELRQKFVDEAIKYIGVKEGSSKHKYIVDTYNKISPLPVNYKVKYTDAWCATFVSFVGKQCGLLDIIPAECGCERQIELWKKLGRWKESDSYKPNVGTIVYYDWQDDGVGDNKGHSDHVGIVVSVSNNMIKVIEGNMDDKVGYRNIAVNGKSIRGFGEPNFASKATKTSSTNKVSTSNKKSVCSIELEILKKGSKGQSVKALQSILVKSGYSVGLSGVDGIFGSGTDKAVKKFQTAKKLESDGIVGKMTWTALLS